MSLINESPYLDKYDPKKHYSQLLAVPGRVAQAREITEIQTTVKDIIKSVGDSFMNDGDILEGCQIAINTEDMTARISAGRIYLNGIVFTVADPIDESDPDYGKNIIPITGQEEELICVRLTESIVTSSEDPDLVDPAIGYENYKQPGCDRLKTELEFLRVLPTDEKTLQEVTVLGRIVDGELVQEYRHKYTELTNTLAHRTYDESGSYLVEGLTTRVENVDEDYFNIVVEAGRAYVHGYETILLAANRTKMPRATTFVTIDTGKVNMYTPGSTAFLCQGPYAKEVLEVLGSIDAIKDAVGAEVIDLQGYGTIDLVVKDKEGQGTTTYVAGTDYELSHGDRTAGITDKILWKSAVPQNTLTLTYKKDYIFSPMTDYEVIFDANNDSRLTWKSGGTTPSVNTQFAVKFTKYLARKDTVYIDQYGNISVAQGTPADYGSEVAPEAPTYTLHLASVSSPPGGSVTSSTDDLSIKVNNVGLTRFTMRDIHDIVNRVKEMMYDQSVLSLNTEAKDTDVSGKKGIFTDNMLDFSRLDTLFNLTSSGEKINEDAPIYDVALDLDSNMIHLPLETNTIDVNYIPGDSTIEKATRIASLNSSSTRIVLSQLKANKSFLITPYVSLPQNPEIQISPNQDSWYDDTIITIPKSVTQSRVVSSSSRWSSSIRRRTSRRRSGTRIETSTQDSVVGNHVQTVISENVVSEKATTYIRQREITVTGTHYPNNLDNIACYFDNKKLDLTPIAPTVAGTNAGTIRAGASGSFTAKFTIPGGIFKTGTRVVNLESPIKRDGFLSNAETYYKANGIDRVIHKTVTTITTLLLHRVTKYTRVRYYHPDPLAQTFTLEDNTVLTAVDIYFEGKPAIPVGGSAAPVTCEIRETSNGTISTGILGTKTLEASQIITSGDSSKATRFVLEDPIVLDGGVEYAIVLRSSSMDYSVYGAEINGDKDMITGEPIVSNTYIQGVLQTSSNNTSWTVHQKADLKFALVANNYVNQSVINFENIHVDKGFCRISLGAESLEFDNTNISWEYSLDGGTSYQPLYPYSIDTTTELATDILLRATLKKTSDTLMSPLIDMDSITLSLAAYANEEHNYGVFNYISGLDPYDKLTIFLDVYTSASLPIKVYMSPDKSIGSTDPYTLIEIPRDTSYDVSVNGLWREYKYELDNIPELAGVQELTNCRIFVDLHNNLNLPYVAQTPACRRLRAIMSNSTV